MWNNINIFLSNKKNYRIYLITLSILVIIFIICIGPIMGHGNWKNILMDGMEAVVMFSVFYCLSKAFYSHRETK